MENKLFNKKFSQKAVSPKLFRKVLSKQKAVSPLIATVLIVAFTITAAIIVVSSLTSVTSEQTKAISTKQECARGGLFIIESGCTSKEIIVVVQNIGTVDLSNFTVFANINNQLYTNNTPRNGNSVLSKGGLLTLYANTSLSGAIKSILVMAGNCPQVSMEITNDTKSIGTC